MKTKVIPLIAEYFFEDWERTAQVLGGTGADNPFLERVPLAIPKGMAVDRKQAHRWKVREEFAPGAYQFLVDQN